jgi:hypothetical protein
MPDYERIKTLRSQGLSMQTARHIAEQEEMIAALAKASVDENLRWVIEKLIVRMPRDGRD